MAPAPINYTITLTGQGEGDPAELEKAYRAAVHGLRRTGLPVGGQLSARVEGTRDEAGTLTEGRAIHSLAGDVPASKR